MKNELLILNLTSVDMYPLLNEFFEKFDYIKTNILKHITIDYLRAIKSRTTQFCIFLINKDDISLKFDGVYNLIKDTIILQNKSNNLKSVLIHELSHALGVSNHCNNYCVMNGLVTSSLCNQCITRILTHLYTEKEKIINNRHLLPSVVRGNFLPNESNKLNGGKKTM